MKYRLLNSLEYRVTQIIRHLDIYPCILFASFWQIRLCFKTVNTKFWYYPFRQHIFDAKSDAISLYLWWHFLFANQIYWHTICHNSLKCYRLWIRNCYVIISETCPRYSLWNFDWKYYWTYIISESMPIKSWSPITR